MKTGPLSVLLLTASVLISCQKDEWNGRLYTYYDYSYSEETDLTTATVIFLDGGEYGAKVQLDGHSFCSLDGDTLEFFGGLGFYYKETSGFDSVGHFAYYYGGGATTYENSVGPMKPIGFPAEDTISMSADYTFQWTGDPVNFSETVSLTISSLSSSDEEVFTTITETDTFLNLSSVQLDNLGTGWKEFRLTRSYNTTEFVASTDKGGRIAMSYEAYKQVYIQP